MPSIEDRAEAAGARLALAGVGDRGEPVLDELELDLARFGSFSGRNRP
jgi:hypothetical protein